MVALWAYLSMFIVGANLSPVCTWMTLPIKGQHVGTMKTGPLYIVFLRDSDCKSQATLCFYAVFAANSQPSEKSKPSLQESSYNVDIALTWSQRARIPALILSLCKLCKSFFFFWPVYWLMMEREDQLLHLVVEKSKWKTASESIYKL